MSFWESSTFLQRYLPQRMPLETLLETFITSSCFADLHIHCIEEVEVIFWNAKKGSISVGIRIHAQTHAHQHTRGEACQGYDAAAADATGRAMSMPVAASLCLYLSTSISMSMRQGSRAPDVVHRALHIFPCD